MIVVAGRGVIAEALDGGWAAGLSGRHGGCRHVRRWLVSDRCSWLRVSAEVSCAAPPRRLEDFTMGASGRWLRAQCDSHVVAHPRGRSS